MKAFLKCIVKNKVILFLIILIFISYLLRIFLLPDNLFVGPEQGIDYVHLDNLVKNMKPILIGQKTDIEGIFHGPVFYYLTLPPFILFKGDPWLVSAYFIFINCLTVIGIYKLTVSLFKNQKAALLAGMMFAVSFGAVSQSRWISSPPLSIPFSCLFFYYLYRFLQNKPRSSLYLLLSYTLLSQVEILNYFYFGLIFVLSIIIYRRNWIKVNLLLKVFFGFIFSITNFIFFDLRHNFLITNSIHELLIGHRGFKVGYIESFYSAFVILISDFSKVIGVFNLMLSAVVLICLLIFLIINIKKNKNYVILLLWILIPPLLIAVTRHSSLEQFYISLTPVFIITFSLLIDKILNYSILLGIFIYVIYLFLNLYSIYKFMPTNLNVFFQSTQPDLRYEDQLRVVDWVYKSSKGNDFSVRAYTIPYWVPDAWTYIFSYIGQKKYGYVPRRKEGNLVYVIRQYSEANQRYMRDWYDRDIRNFGKKGDSAIFGVLEVEQRIF